MSLYDPVAQVERKTKTKTKSKKTRQTTIYVEHVTCLSPRVWRTSRKILRENKCYSEGKKKKHACSCKCATCFLDTACSHTTQLLLSRNDESHSLQLGIWREFPLRSDCLSTKRNQATKQTTTTSWDQNIETQFSSGTVNLRKIMNWITIWFLVGILVYVSRWD